MALPVYITDSGVSGKNSKASVTDIGQLITAPFAYDEVSNAIMIASGTAYNLFEPKANKQFVITTILFTAKKDVTTDEIIDIYETEDLTSTVVTKSIMEIEMLKNSSRDFIGLNLLVSEGAFINAKADDATTLITMMGYYIPVVT
jgi:hypothetical protein